VGVFRVALLLANAALLAFIVGLAVTDPEGGEWLGYAVISCFLANIVYLLLNPWRVQWHVFRVVSLWFDAKEAELRARAQKAQENSN
jgi:hypothetical protein